MRRIYCKTRRIRRVSYGYACAAERAYVRAQLTYICTRATRACTLQSCLNVAANEIVYLDSYKSERHADYCRLLDSLHTVAV